MSWRNNSFLKSALVKNSAWGLISNILQNLFVCLFFVIVARKFSVNEFAQFLIATTVYQLVAAFSSMGLGQWFIRQFVVETDKLVFTSKFLKTQIGLGLLFYLVNIALAFIIYPDGQIRLLCIILGTNIIFDNFINAIKSLNIAEFRQNKTAAILVIDGLLKLLVGCLLLVSPFSSVVLSVLMIVVRILTLSLFIKLGSSNSISIKLLWNAYISYGDVKQLIIKNWQFIVIGSISIIYWRIGNIVISKILTLTNVADYEISCRIFSILSIVPVIASATIYPQFIKYYNEKNYTALTKFYNTLFLVYTLFSVLSYAFIYSFAPWIIPVAFGQGYPGAVVCLQQMFLTFLIFPTVLLQANLIVAIGLEKMDMVFNIVSLLINLAGCLIGLYFFKSLSVVNYSILFSFVIFHILQDILLVRKKLINTNNYMLFYVTLVLFVFFYQYLATQVNPYIFFISFSAILITACLIIALFKKNKLNTIGHLGPVLSDK